jgi:dephospho-CoA kinase
MLVIGLTGTKASGKGEVAEYLKAQGFQYYSLSDVVRKEAEYRGLVDAKITQLQDIGDELRKKYGLGVLARRVIEEILHDTSEKYLVDGIRNPGEIKELRDLTNSYIIAIDAPQEIRAERLIKKRARESDPKNLQDFLKVDERDRGIGAIDAGQQVQACISLADYNIMNDSTLEELHKKTQDILEEIERIEKLGICAFNPS